MKYDNNLLLYAITDRRWLNKETLYDQVKKVLDGGATFIQLREKELDKKSFLKEAKEIKKLCKEYNVPFVVNDDIDIAIEADVDGVHVGQDDMNVSTVRAKLGPNKIIGVSVQTVEQALLAEKNGADYLGVGAIFPTHSKKDTISVSYETLKEICKTVNVPVVAIGGINKDNLMNLKQSGICGIAVISALFAQQDIKEATKSLKKLTNTMLNI